MRSISSITILICLLLARTVAGKSNALSFTNRSHPLASVEIDKTTGSKSSRLQTKLSSKQQTRSDNNQHQLEKKSLLHDVEINKPSSGNIDKDIDRMPSLFTKPEEFHLDKYAACLAATEGLRRGMMVSKAKQQSTFSASSKKGVWNGSNISKLLTENDSNTTEDEKQATAQYVRKSTQIVKMIGLTVPQFNQIGRELEDDSILKDKVLEQAYLYRLAATVQMSKTPILIEDPTTSKLLQAHKRDRVAMFANAITEIETLRGSHLEKLKSQYGQDVAKLPNGVNLCDPGLLPLLSPRLRAVCEAFPHQAEDIVRGYGLESDEFNSMLDKIKRDPIFRWKVRKYMNDGGEALNTARK